MKKHCRRCGSSMANLIELISSEMEDLPDRIWVTEKVRSLEADLSAELKELKGEIEENDMIHGIQRTVR